MIKIQQSKTADSRTCDVSKVSKEQLLLSSKQHTDDVMKGMLFFANMLIETAIKHDHDKFSGIDQFYADFRTKFESTKWWDNHLKVNRHHLLEKDGIREDVNLIDVLDMIVDCVMAGLGRAGSVYPLDINPDVLMKAFNNTVKILKSQVVVED